MTISDTIGNIFNFLPEMNLIEEYLYNHSGSYPVYSGQTKDQGILGFIDSYNQQLPCATFTTYGVGAGKLFYRQAGKFTIGRNCMGLRPKKEYSKEINLEWFVFSFQNLFYSLRRGDIQGQGSLNHLLLERQPIVIPNIDTQLQQLKKYKLLESMRNQVHSPIHKLTEIRHFTTDYPPGATIAEGTLGTFMDFIGGNSGLTEEFIYDNYPESDTDRVEILTSATLEREAMGFISKNAKIENRELKMFETPAILVARNGYAGTMTYISHGFFTTNDHAYVLTAKNEWKDKINLEWFSNEYQELFFQIVTSRSDNATFNKEYAERQTIKIPHIDYQNAIVGKLNQAKKTMKKLKVLESKVGYLLDYSIT
jgi:type I restriction enzyme S subunit